MHPTPTTRGRHALRWVVGVGLAFVVVVAMALQVARRRADERWEAVVAHCEESWLGTGTHWEVPLDAVLVRSSGPPAGGVPCLKYTWGSGQGGNIIQAWREALWGDSVTVIILRQERVFFGNSIEAQFCSGDDAAFSVARDVLAEIDVELVVEPWGDP